ncbi:putative transporter small subunit [Georgenia thermotolerans]|nr:putative transporter small subunit [Georgenia thermotolerans]
METMLSAYVLMWPAAVFVIMTVIARGFAKDVREAREEGRDVI